MGSALVIGPSLADQATDTIRKSLAEKLPDIKVDGIEPSVVPGLYEVVMGGRVFYMSADGRYLVAGEISNLETGINYTEQKMSTVTKAAIDKVSEQDMVKFGSDDAKYKVTVFTDVDCGYCRKLHSEIDGYIKEGIQIRYLAFPRAGITSESFSTAEKIWCSDNRQAALTMAKKGQKLPGDGSCKNPVAEQYALGQAIGVNGTPALVMPNGELVPGYLPPAKLKAHLEEISANK